jgi:hypothetical protein
VAKPSIIGYIENMLRKDFDDEKLKIAELFPSTGDYSIVDSKGNNIITDSQGHTVGLMPFKVRADITHWVSLFMHYNFIEERVTSVSIGFYDEGKTIIFRAEWCENEDQTAHAQPHWHVHNKPLHPQSSFLNKELCKEFPDDLADEMRDKYKNIHFTMSASWDNASSIVQPLISKPHHGLLKWISGVIRYSLNQLVYLYDKKASAVT